MKSVRNRWGTRLKLGDFVRFHSSRGIPGTGFITRIFRENGSVRLEIDKGITIGRDDATYMTIRNPSSRRKIVHVFIKPRGYSSWLEIHPSTAGRKKDWTKTAALSFARRYAKNLGAAFKVTQE